jgi:hypothetical protein
LLYKELKKINIKIQEKQKISAVNKSKKSIFISLLSVEKLNIWINFSLKKNIRNSWVVNILEKTLVKFSFIILNIKLKNIINFYKIFVKKDKVEKDITSKKKFGTKPIKNVKKIKGKTE